MRLGLLMRHNVQDLWNGHYAKVGLVVSTSSTCTKQENLLNAKHVRNVKFDRNRNTSMKHSIQFDLQGIIITAARLSGSHIRPVASVNLQGDTANMYIELRSLKTHQTLYLP